MEEPKTYPKKRLSIIIEAPYLNRLLELLDDIDVPGYTALSALAGKGKSGPWRRDELPSDAGRMIQVLVVIDEDKVPMVLREVAEVLEHQMGIVSLSDVEVLRPELF